MDMLRERAILLNSVLFTFGYKNVKTKIYCSFICQMMCIVNNEWQGKIFFSFSNE